MRAIQNEAKPIVPLCCMKGPLYPSVISSRTWARQNVVWCTNCSHQAGVCLIVQNVVKPQNWQTNPVHDWGGRCMVHLYLCQRIWPTVKHLNMSVDLRLNNSMLDYLYSDMLGVGGCVLTMLQSRWADTPVIDRSTSELRHRSTASESQQLALVTSPPPLLSWPGQTADGHRPGNKNSGCHHCKRFPVLIYFKSVDMAFLQVQMHAYWMYLTNRPCSIPEIYL